MHDYVIVGAGSAGRVLANRLPENLRHRGLPPEAGPRDRHPPIRMPKGISGPKGDPRFSSAHPVEPEAGRPPGEAWVRGRVVGGSSPINGMVYVRGQPDDYDAGAELGNRGWGSTPPCRASWRKPADRRPPLAFPPFRTHVAARLMAGIVPAGKETEWPKKNCSNFPAR